MTDSLIGHTFDGYELKEYVGRDHFIEIYKGFDDKVSRWARIRCISMKYVTDKELARFRSHVPVLANLRHPNVSIIYSYGATEEWVYLVQEDVPGGSLQELLPSGNPLTWEQALTIVIPISQALAYAHKEGITDWHIKPANILLPQDGWPLLATHFVLPKGSMPYETDAGIVGPGPGFGTGFANEIVRREIAYVAPELIKEAEPDGRSDIYSLGVTLYELLSGRLPFEDETSFDFLMARLTEPPLPLLQANPTLPHIFGPILEKALAPDPNDRYQTMEEFSNILSQAQTRLNRSIAGKYDVVAGEAEAIALNGVPRTPGMAIVIRLSESGQVIFAGGQPELTIGRTGKKTVASTPDIDLTSYGGRQAGVSRQHGRLLYENEQWSVEDLGSANGIFVNGVKIPARQLVPIDSGDLLRFGRVELQFSTL